MAHLTRAATLPYGVAAKSLEKLVLTQRAASLAYGGGSGPREADIFSKLRLQILVLTRASYACLWCRGIWLKQR